jgi:hypothetical protein
MLSVVWIPWIWQSEAFGLERNGIQQVFSPWLPLHIRLKALGETIKEYLIICLLARFRWLECFLFQMERYSGEHNLKISRNNKVIKTSDQPVSNHKICFHIVLFCLNNRVCSKRDAVCSLLMTIFTTKRSKGWRHWPSNAVSYLITLPSSLLAPAVTFNFQTTSHAARKGIWYHKLKHNDTPDDELLIGVQAIKKFRCYKHDWLQSWSPDFAFQSEHGCGVLCNAFGRQVRLG